MNIVPKKAPKWQPSAPKDEEPPVNKQVTMEVKEVPTEPADISKDKSDDDLDAKKSDKKIFNTVKPPSPKGAKKKKKLSDKQRAHLAKIRQKSLEARRAKAAAKKEEKANKLKEQKAAKAAETKRRQEALVAEKKRINLERKAKDDLRKNDRLKKQQLKNANLLAVLDHWYENKQKKKKAAREAQKKTKAKPAAPAPAAEAPRQYQGRYSAFGGSNQQPLRGRRSRINQFGYREFY
jgi:hypothetical protein